MLEHVDASQIPKYFGGTQTDEDGDPRCLHKVTKTKLYGKRQMELFFTILKEEKRKRKKKNDNSVHHTQSTVSQCVCVCTFSTFIIMYVKICNKIFQINWGGKIPKELYVVRDEKDNNNDEFVDTIIKKGSKIKLEFKCKEAGCALK